LYDDGCYACKNFFPLQVDMLWALEDFISMRPAVGRSNITTFSPGICDTENNVNLVTGETITLKDILAIANMYDERRRQTAPMLPTLKALISTMTNIFSEVREPSQFAAAFTITKRL
jgi:hypothetical protein